MSIPKFDSNPLRYDPTPSPSQASSKPRQLSTTSRSKPRQNSISLSDIVAKDAARSYVTINLDLLVHTVANTEIRSMGFSQTLGSLGFAPNETLEDFLDMSFNPEPVEQPFDPDPGLGSEQDQRAYYELLMGKQFK